MSLMQLIFEFIITVKFPVISKIKISEALLKLNHAAVISKYPPLLPPGEVISGNLSLSSGNKIQRNYFISSPLPPSLRMWSAEIYPCYQFA